MLKVYWIPRHAGESIPRLVAMGDTGKVLPTGHPLAGGGLVYELPENDINKGFIANMTPPYYKEDPRGDDGEIKTPEATVVKTGEPVVKIKSPIKKRKKTAVKGASRARSSKRPKKTE